MNIVLKRIWLFYYEGFKSMTLGKTLWMIILIKLFIMFFILKLFFFKDDLRMYDSEQEKQQHIIHELTLEKR
ncbi:MAG: DUF4492 domain-containing protein [Bacteroidales bacterium]|nr:DUF4492 domain-containing protein [Bacteroidales bacterium]